MRPALAPTTQAITQTIGDTPLVKLQKIVPPGSADVYVKLEFFNPTGSYKDRLALAVIEEAEKRGDLRAGMTVVEYTGGSTGASLAFVCACKGYRCRLVSSSAFAGEKLQTMRAFGAQLELVESETGAITPELVARVVARTEALAAEEDTYYTNQFYNRDALKGYACMGEELLSQLGPIDAFCGAVGTAGMVMGVASVLKERAATRVVVLEPAASAVITTGRAGPHHVEGVGVGFVPPLLDTRLYDEARAISEGEARRMARRLAEEEGLFAGVSSGLNVVGALRVAEELGEGRTVVTVACDTGLKYLSGELFER